MAAPPHVTVSPAAAGSNALAAEAAAAAASASSSSSSSVSATLSVGSAIDLTASPARPPAALPLPQSPAVEQKRVEAKKAEFQSSGPPEILPHEIEYFEKIGGGCFGQVFRGKCRGKEVAIKKLFKQSVDEKALNEFKKEVEIMCQLRHPNCILFMGACTTPGHMALVTEMLKGNLQTLLHDPKMDLSLARRTAMAIDTALGMNWLHCSKPSIIHRDLKPSNLLIDEHYSVKVCDFGLSAVKKPGETLRDKDGIPGTPLWMAPEVLSGRNLDEKADIYSFGIVLWEILTRQEPFPEMEDYQQFKRAILSGERPPIPKDLPRCLADILELSWHREPSKRPSFADLLPMLDTALVAVAVHDEVGAAFWRKFFVAKEKVLWPDFHRAFHTFLRLPGVPCETDVAWRGLRMLLATPNPDNRSDPDIVTLEGFGKLLEWFGPLSPDLVSSALSTSGSGIAGKAPASASAATATTSAPASSSSAAAAAAAGGAHFMERLLNVIKQPWFHGYISKDESETLLVKQGKGTFLVRLSTTSAGSFTISKMSKSGKVNHQRIDYKTSTQTFRLQTQATKKAPSVPIEGTESLENFLLKKLATELYLKEPCPGSKFQILFLKPKNIEGYLLTDDDDE